MAGGADAAEGGVLGCRLKGAHHEPSSRSCPAALRSPLQQHRPKPVIKQLAGAGILLNILRCLTAYTHGTPSVPMEVCGQSTFCLDHGEESVEPLTDFCMHLQELEMRQSATLGRQMEILLNFTAVANASQSGGQQPFSVGVQLSTGEGTSTRIVVNGTAAIGANQTLNIAQVRTAHATMIATS